jgi:hypothetical protein
MSALAEKHLDRAGLAIDRRVDCDFLIESNNLESQRVVRDVLQLCVSRILLSILGLRPSCNPWDHGIFNRISTLQIRLAYQYRPACLYCPQPTADLCCARLCADLSYPWLNFDLSYSRSYSGRCCN